ncbi:hypothetical protein E2C01_005953 [Portunus trituberculatus]|uniref:Uncharacterized protein n=1 Tax=Portunus trituberculatus TaxID=210409 RepID=A0A5B7CVM0_PORTR|nr:hypothetical protein [Portunus trituberculatus]
MIQKQSEEKTSFTGLKGPREPRGHQGQATHEARTPACQALLPTGGGKRSDQLPPPPPPPPAFYALATGVNIYFFRALLKKKKRS